MQLGKTPWIPFLKWHSEAVSSGIKEPDAMTLATATPKGVPSARIVLFKGINSDGIRFFTNHRSRKGKELHDNPRAALVFYWSNLNRQIRIEGRIHTLSAQESDDYWNTRPRESR